MSLQICQYQNKNCGCQNYLDDQNNPEKCYYCGHFNAFHLEFLNETSNLGICQQNSAHCGCQGFDASSENALKCRYCNHFNAFHLPKPLLNNNALNLLSQLPTLSSISNSSSTVSNRQFSTPREEVLSNFRPQLITPLNLNMNNTRRRNNNRNPATSLTRGRPKDNVLRLNHMLLFENSSWKDQQPPREYSKKWEELKEANQIATNVIFGIDAPNAINEVVSEMFSLNTESNWIILNGSTSKLKIATSQEKTLVNLRNNTTKSNKLLYIALETNLEAINNDSEVLETNSEAINDDSEALEINLEADSESNLDFNTYMNLDDQVNWFEGDEVVEVDDSIEINSTSTIASPNVDLTSIIRNFRNKIEHDYPNALAKTIYLTGKTYPSLLEDVMSAVRSFNEDDFIKWPIIDFVNELGIDTGGVFNDTLRIIFEQFSGYKNIEQIGGNGRIFTDCAKKLINPFLLVEFCDYLQDLDEIDGFKDWSEANNFQKASYTMFNKDHASLTRLAEKIKYDTLIMPIFSQLNVMKNVLNKFQFIEFIKSKDICSKDFIEHFSIPLISSSQVAENLKFLALSPETTVIKGWFKKWIETLSVEKLKKFCIVVTGFEYPKEEIMVHFKSENSESNLDNLKTPTIRTCINQIAIYRYYNSKEELFSYLNTILMFDDDGFTIC
ncbi:hypothetical protein RhiirC2_790576 [Rhizophagus irregularis]|uniref:HECT domain-containing protein n=1 Tax=Rhizophagus irregularis TaxID=588596 RepID=A0A2N1ML03_9GLOM|nr:hypothetical protein RhiirC2_790576 [Rhizophagus irregularis]